MSETNGTAPLRLPRREGFAQAVASGKSYTEAYMANYPTKSGAHAKEFGSKLAIRHPDVVARIASLRAVVTRDTQITLATLIALAQDALEFAFRTGNASAAVQAIKELGILSGHRVERREHQAVKKKDMREMSDAEIMEMIEEARANRRAREMQGDVDVASSAVAFRRDAP
jgi:hypothetical protein